MLRSAKSINEQRIEAVDGHIGHVVDIFFDDTEWIVRYVVVDLGTWIPDRKVLIATAALGQPRNITFPVNLTKDQIRNSPDIDFDKPVSRRHEAELHYYYGWPAYWGATAYGEPAPGETTPPAGEPDEGETHLRSARAVMGYHILSENGEIGHIEDFIVDDALWTIRYVAVDTANWLPGKKVLMAPDWIESIDWKPKKVFVQLTQDEIRNCPEYDPNEPINRAYEERLYDYYGRPRYWMERVGHES
ncbi:MAG: PRC-barrel domain containing protein [Chitinivibrionales bacterium]|nr:PRC-barrel domain containing protein [Chitinivibrionales bacterium]MBD3396511.1 PRC-barrel domain containing protein [Chitinivibrionales bacterium]